MVKKLLPVLLLLLLIVPTFSTLLRNGYFPMHDDMQAMRLLQMDKCVKDGQIPCRWVPDMGYGYGYPQFNFYAPLPYYLMEAVHLVGFGYLDSVKVGFILSVVVSGIGMYLLAKELWGQTGGLVSALFYSYANYRAVDMYVRGAVGEFWGLAFMPLIFWSIYRIYKNDKNAVFWAAISLAGLLTSHNITTLIFIPVIILWVLVLPIYLSPSPIKIFKANFLKLFIASFWSFFISSFFLLPAWIEKEYVHVETLLQGYFNYLAHFVGLDQLLLSTYFGYGASDAGVYDELSLSVGMLLWLMPLLILLLLWIFRKRKKFGLMLFFVVVGWIALFMTHSKSTVIWQRIKILEYLQFPWRFLSIATFVFSVATGAITILLKNRKQRFIAVLAVFILLFFLNSSYFVPSKWLNITDKDKFSGESWERQLTISIFDYLPIYAKAPPAQKAPDKPLFISGSGKILAGNRGSNWQEWNVSVDSESEIELPLYYFPGFKVNVDGSERQISHDGDLGLIRFEIEEGVHTVFVKLYDTPVRTLSNTLSLIGLLAIPLYFYKQKRHV
jgi:hypothetical protein